MSVAQPTVTACLTVNNDEKHLADCLARLVPTVDEVLVVGEESTDRSLDIAREYGTKVVSQDTQPAGDWTVRLSAVDRMSESDATRIRPFLLGQGRDTTTAVMPASTSAGQSQWTFERNSTRVIVDVIVLSYAKTKAEYDMTRRCIETLRASESNVDINVVVVETNSSEALADFSEGQPFGDKCKVIHPEKPFNYNEFLQLGFAELSESTAESLLILNNDIVCEAGFVSELLGGLREFDSVSPWCPGFHERFLDPATPYHEGFRTSCELTGWAIMFRRELLKRVSFEELFPTDFAFWFQDNYYGHQLQNIGARHALVTGAKVHHLFEQSHKLMDPQEREAMTAGAQQVFRDKVAMQTKEPSLLLTVAIPSVPSRSEHDFPRIYSKLCRQAEGKPVEVISLVDNKRSTLGAKRNSLTELAQGKFIVFVDDDDDVSDDYVDSLLESIRSEPNADCIVFDAWVTMSGNDDRVCKYGREYDDVNEADAYYRSPNHVNCFRTDLVGQLPREDMTWGEDSRWSEAMRPRIETESRIDKTLYYYHFDPQGTECPQNAPPRPEPRDMLLTIGVLSVPSRVGTSLPNLVTKLDSQIGDTAVELLVFVDNKHRSVGAKRDALLRRAKGKYVAFVDDDDDVTGDYVDTLLEKLTEEPGADCVVFDTWVTHNGGRGKLCRYGVEYEDHDAGNAYYRKPNHLCCVRTELARQVGFDDVSWHEDFRFASALRPLIQNQSRIDKVLYHYRFATGESETLPETLRSPKPVYGFLHIATMNHWRQVVDELLTKLNASGLYDRTERMFVGVVGPEAELVHFDDPKIEVVYRDADLNKAEFPTLDYLHRFCKETGDSLVYYLHSKGVSHESDRCRDWRQLMGYFNVVRYEECIRELANHDVCGVNWYTEPTGFFSGNFWWARSEYVAKLVPVHDLVDGKAIRRIACEQWIGSGPDVRAACLHKTELNHYHEAYPRSQYATLQEVPPLPALNQPSAWRGLENLFQDLIEPIGRVRTIAEIGVEYGYSLFSLATAAPDATVIGVDPYGELPPEELERLRGLHDAGAIGSNEARQWVERHIAEFPNALLLKSSSADAAEQLSGQIDVLHIDAVNTYEDVSKNFRLWEPKLRPGGCVLFHDTRSFPDTVGRLFSELPGRKAEIRDCHGLGAWYKPSRDESLQLQTGKYCSLETDNERWREGQRRAVTRLFNGVSRKRRILDIACGDGVGLKCFRELGFTEVTGVEFNKTKADMARKHGYEVHELDMHDLSQFDDLSFDVVYSSHTLEHAYELAKVIEELHRVLTNDGELHVILPFPDPGVHNMEAHSAKHVLGTEIDDRGEKVVAFFEQRGFQLVEKQFDDFREPEIWLRFSSHI